MKTCRTCKETKPLGDFYAKKTGRFGVSSTCRPCDNAKSRANYARNAEAISIAGRLARQENGEALRERGRLTYAKNRERIRAGQKEYYERNREARAAYNVRWRAENPEWLRHYEASRRDKKYLQNLIVRFRKRPTRRD